MIVRKPLDLSPAVARAFVNDMRASSVDRQSFHHFMNKKANARRGLTIVRSK
jgi:hypothetical protein